MRKKKVTDISNFYKAQKISEEAKKVLSKNSSATDELDSYIAENRYSEELIANIIDTEKCVDITTNFCHKEKFEEARKLKHIIDNRAKLKTRRKRLYYLSAASTVAAIIALSFVIWQPISTKNIISNSTTLTNNFTAPTLLLGNGNSVNLNEMKSTIINGNVVINRGTDNTISYDNTTVIVPDTNTVIVPSKYTFNVMLEDGTEVTLNANSELRYPVSFNGEKREVFLKGEGYFRVVKGEKPFVVTTNGVNIKVYGTEFNVNTNNCNQIEAILVTGSVGITSDNGDEIILKPNERFTYNKSDKTITLRTIVVENHIGWLDNLFKCDNEKLYTLLNKIASWYNVEFNYSNIDIVNVPISVNFSRTSELDTILKALETISDVKFIKKNQKEYVIE